MTDSVTTHHSPLTSGDTICAPATATGGALAVIRVSGPAAFSIVSTLCSLSCAAAAANTVHFTRLTTPVPDVSPSGGLLGEIIDEALVTVFRAPHSYTGEDSVEISCHGSTYIVRRILDLLIQNGCRMARPGEFTQRAYLNGKLDLSQAEAVADLIASTNRATHDIAMSQLRGHFSSELKTLRDQLLKLTSLLELELDFSDHEDLEFADRSELLALAQKIEARITYLAQTFETGQALKQGIPVAIVGKTNVGKSTLLNQLVDDERAIVSDIHGTTRDTIEETMEINGIQFRFIDTAGLRETTDEIERIGIQRTYAAIDKARIVLWLFDAPPTAADISDMTARCSGRALIPILNKTDLHPALSSAPVPAPVPVCGRVTATTTTALPISAKHSQGISALKSAIYQAADIPTLSSNDVIVTSARHYDALIRAHHNLQHVLDGLSINLSGDLLSEDLRLVLADLAEITGEGQITPQETLNNIFSHFCVGK